MTDGVNGLRHVAVIMDGNGRWAKQRGLPRSAGHREGAKALSRAVRACLDLHIPVLSVFCFSTENWNRPKDEIDALFSLLREALDKDFKELGENGVRIRFAGDLTAFPQDIRDKTAQLVEATRDNAALQVVFAMNYGGRTDILNAAKEFARQVKDGALSVDEATEDTFARFLYLPDLPAPDLLIRTSGEKRISNFWLWQAAYAELYFTPVLWPDFTKNDLQAALDDFAARKRRFGGV